MFHLCTQISCFKGIPSLSSWISAKETSLNKKQIELLCWILNPKTFTLHHKSLSEVIILIINLHTVIRKFFVVEEVTKIFFYRKCTNLYMQGRSQGGHRGHLPSPFFPELLRNSVYLLFPTVQVQHRVD